MYRPPENANRVKAIKSKFENSTVDTKTKLATKAPLRKSRTLQDFNTNKTINNGDLPTHNKQNKVQKLITDCSNTNGELRVQNNTTPTSLSRQLSDPAKRNIKRTPAFRLDKSTLSDKVDQKNARLLQNKSRYLDSKLSKLDNAVQENESVNFKERLSRTKINGYGHTKLSGNFSDIRSKFNNKGENENDNNKSNTHQINDSNNVILKYLYSEPLPKSQRIKTETKNEDINNDSNVQDTSNISSNTLDLDTSSSKTKDTSNNEDIYNNSSTLKLSDSPKLQPVSDDESHYSNKKNFTKDNPLYGSLRAKKSFEETSSSNGKIAALTDTLKNALKKPLPTGPAPKKPPRTFLHSPIRNESTSEISPSPLNLDKDFTKRLNTELQKNISPKKTRNKGDPKYMLDKLETALKSKGILTRKPKQETTTTSEDDSDNEKSKFKLLNLRDLPDIPTTSSSQTLSNVYYSPPETSPKFNFNCLTSLGCVTSTYEAVKESNSSFFVTTKREEPVYAEPFEYQVEVEKRVKTETVKDGAIDSSDVASASMKTIRRSLHYASSPVPDLKSGENTNHVSEAKCQDQATFDSTSPSSACTSDMDSIASTPSEENKTLVPSIKVKDLIKAIENNNCSKIPIDILKTNTNTSAIKDSINYSNSNNHSDSQTDDDRIKKLKTQLKNTLDKSFSTTSTLNSDSIDIQEDDCEDKHEAQFETYVKRVRSKIFCRSRKRKEHLFHCCLLVALDRCTPYVKSKFPEHVEEPHKIADLCFPEVENGPMDTSVKAQCYSLIITNELGERTFGYCRRVLPEASTACLPLAYCILSKHHAPGFYRRVLEELEYRHGYADKFKYAFLEELYNCKFPQPGETIAIDCARIISSSGCDKARDYKTMPSEYNNKIDSDYSTNNCGVSMTKCCDKKDLTRSLNNRKKRQCSENDEEQNELDLKTYVIVCNNGEYGTLMRGNKTNNKNNVIRGSSAVINIPIPYEILPNTLKRCNSTPALPADLESLPSELVFMRPRDSRHEEDDLELLGETLKMPVLQQIFCSLLLERKVILVSCVLSKLSSCIEALQIVLYPFSWQHTIIPVLPTSLWEIADTPTPLVCGVLSSELVNEYAIENGIVVDLDTGSVLLQVGDEDKILPWSLVQTLKNGLSLANKITSNKSGAHNVFLSDAFLRVFIQSCGHYKNHIVDGQFEKADFIQASKQKGKRIRQFLTWFTETTMFYNFIEMALNESSSLDLFDQRIKIYGSESASEILNKMKNWTNHNYKSLLTNNLHRFQ